MAAWRDEGTNATGREAFEDAPDEKKVRIERIKKFKEPAAKRFCSIATVSITLHICRLATILFVSSKKLHLNIMRLVAALIAIVPSFAFAGNFATCLLKNLPGLQSDAAAYGALKLCQDEYPGGLGSVKQGAGRGFLAYKSGAECAMKKAGETRSVAAGNGISAACRKLYDEPNEFDAFDQK